MFFSDSCILCWKLWIRFWSQDEFIPLKWFRFRDRKTRHDFFFRWYNEITFASNEFEERGDTIRFSDWQSPSCEVLFIQNFDFIFIVHLCFFFPFLTSRHLKTSSQRVKDMFAYDVENSKLWQIEATSRLFDRNKKQTIVVKDRMTKIENIVVIFESGVIVRWRLLANTTRSSTNERVASSEYVFLTWDLCESPWLSFWTLTLTSLLIILSSSLSPSSLISCRPFFFPREIDPCLKSPLFEYRILYISFYHSNKSLLIFCVIGWSFTR